MEIFIFYGWYDVNAFKTLSKIYEDVNMEYNEEDIILGKENPNKTAIAEINKTGYNYKWDNLGTKNIPMYILIMETIMLREFGDPTEEPQMLWGMRKKEKSKYINPKAEKFMITNMKKLWFI